MGVNRGALQAIKDFTDRGIAKQEKLADSRREFEELIIRSGIKDQLERGTLQVNPEAINARISGQPFQGPLLQEGQGIVEQPIPEGFEKTGFNRDASGKVTTERFKKKKKEEPPKGLSEKDAQKFLAPAKPGTPFPSRPVNITVPVTTRRKNAEGRETTSTTRRVVGQGGGIPTSPKGRVTLQKAIDMGLTESPAAIVNEPERAPRTRRPLRGKAKSDIKANIKGGFDNIKGGLVGAIFGPGGALVGANPQGRGFVTAIGKKFSGGAVNELPDPGDLAEGTVATDEETGQQWQIVNGQWVEL